MKFFKPKSWLIALILIIDILLFFEAGKVFSRVGGTPSNIEGVIVVAAVLLIPLSLIYLLISLIILIVSRIRS